MAIVPVSVASSIRGCDGGAVGSVLALEQLGRSWLVAPLTSLLRPFEPGPVPLRPPALQQPPGGLNQPAGPGAGWELAYPPCWYCQG